ncbi:MAG: hypothetical protein U0Z26_12245 [Anaerolineales bacterium]
MPSKFSFRVTLLLLMVLFTTAWNIIRVWTAFHWSGVLDEFSSKPTAFFIIVSGIFWSIAGFVLIWSLWQKKAWALNLLLGAAISYTVWYWSERLIWQIPRPNWPFAVILNLVVLIYVFFTIKSLTREAYERKSENPKIE